MDINIRDMHSDAKDGTSMYVLVDKIDYKKTTLKSIIPALLLYAVVSLLMNAVFQNSLSSKLALAMVTTVPAIIVSFIFQFYQAKAKYKDLGKAYFLDYELGRRFLIGLGVSLIAIVMFVYYVYVSIGILALAMTQIVLVFALLIGNIILLFLTYELASYIFFGLLTFLVNMFTFSLMNALVEVAGLGQFEWSWLIAQTVSFIVTILFAFYVNRQYVFSENSANIWKDLWNFATGRIFSTLVLENGSIFLLFNVMSLDLEFSKLVGAILVTIANYFISKIFVFKNDKK